jgi:uncharacterized protein (DUF488 family)
MRVFTLGTDHRSQIDFTRILWKYGIQVVFDVRRIPESREDHFRRDGLQALCAAQGMDYVFLGNELGGPTHHADLEWTRTDEFARGLAIISGKAPKRVCCILCAERFPDRCHRRTVSDLLARSGIEVVHIIEENRVYQPPAMPASDTARSRRNPTRQRGPR